jgi:hypothetical protein
VRRSGRRCCPGGAFYPAPARRQPPSPHRGLAPRAALPPRAGDEERMARALRRGAPRSHAQGLALEAGRAELRFERRAGIGGPDGEYATGGERAGHPTDPSQGIEPGVLRDREGVGTIVDVEEHDVPAPRIERDTYVALEELDAFVAQRVTGEGSEDAAVVTHHRGQEFRHNDARLVVEGVEGRAEGEAHAEATDEHPGPLACAEALGCDLGQSLLRAADGARHQRLSADSNDVMPALEGELQGRTVGGRRLVEDLPRLHGVVSAYARGARGRGGGRGGS